MSVWLISAAYKEGMDFFHLYVSVLPVVLCSVLRSANIDMSRSLMVFVAMVSLVVVSLSLAMAGLAVGWKTLLSPAHKRTTIGSFVVFLLIVTSAALISVSRVHFRRQVVSNRVSERRPVRDADREPAARAPAPVQHAAVVATQGAASARPLRSPISRRRRGYPFTHHRSVPQPELGKIKVPKEAGPPSVASELLAKKTTIVVHGNKVLSESQAKRVCNAVSLYAGTQVYIRWSPGTNPEQLARQLSQVMDCARVTVTFASASAALEGHGVRVGTHADEGETTDRIRPFADAMAIALREQGFVVAEISGPTIPADQTAIFIGPD